MALPYLSELIGLVILVANLPCAIASSCAADNVLRALRAEGEVGVLDCQYLLSIPQPTFVVTETITITETYLSKTKTVKSSGTSTVIASEIDITHTDYTTTYLPYLPTYASQYPESRLSSACSCISQPVITIGHSLYITTSTTIPGTTTLTHYPTIESITTTNTWYIPATKTYPAICYSSFLTLNFATANAQRAATTLTLTPTPTSTSSNEDCCMSCFHAKNCLYWSNDPNSGSGCKIVLGTEKVGDLILSICPLGIGKEGGLDKPGDMKVRAYNPGPCLKGDEKYLFAAPFN